MSVTYVTAPERAIRALRIRRRLKELPDRCSALLAGLDNSEDDPTLVLGGLPYGDVMQLAIRYPSVRAAVAALPADWSGWNV